MSDISEVVEPKDELKKLQVTERLQKREEERLRNVQQRKAVKIDEVVVEETGNFFSEQFMQDRQDIERRLGSLVAGTNESTTKQFDGLILDVQKLQKFLTDSTRFLLPYQLEKAQMNINQLRGAIEEKRNAVEPKKKFAFKSDRKKQAATESATSVDKNVAAVKPLMSTSASARADQSVADSGFTSRDSETLTLLSGEVDSKDVLLSKLTGCRVQLRGAPATIHMTALQDCTVLCGPTSGSVFIDDCTRCTFVVACHQLRVHRTTATDFYLHVTSRAIIEYCSTVRFAPYNWMYAGLEEDFRKSSLDRQRNNWSAIDDFNWLVSDTRSPNWSLVEESQRVASWTELGVAAE